MTAPAPDSRWRFMDKVNRQAIGDGKCRGL